MFALVELLLEPPLLSTLLVLLPALPGCKRAAFWLPLIFRLGVNIWSSLALRGLIRRGRAAADTEEREFVRDFEEGGVGTAFRRSKVATGVEEDEEEARRVSVLSLRECEAACTMLCTDGLLAAEAGGREGTADGRDGVD